MQYVDDLLVDSETKEQYKAETFVTIPLFTGP